jgi:Leucine-rich repeat (LRR) protein
MSEESGQLVGKTVTIGERVIDNSVEELDLASESITDAEVKLLTQSRKLKTLILGDNSITDVGATEICENLTSLTKLFLNNNQIPDKGTELLYKLKDIKYLDFRANKLTGECAKNISKLTTLTQLSLSNNALDDLAVAELSKLVNLRYLDLTSNKLTNSCVDSLLKLTQLTHFYFSSNQFTVVGIKAILNGLPELTVADARFNAMKNDEKS